jgi:hypothetical protein
MQEHLRGIFAFERLSPMPDLGALVNRGVSSFQLNRTSAGA